MRMRIGREGFDQETVQKAQVIEEQAIRIRSLITNLNTENKLAYGMGNWEKERILLPALIREISCDWLNREYRGTVRTECRYFTEAGAIPM